MLHYPFPAIVAQTELKRALVLAAIDPQLGGVLIEGPRGMAKSTVARALAELLPQGRLVSLPLGASEERVIGSLDLQQALAAGQVCWKPGLLAEADGGVLYVDEVNLLPDHLVDVLLDVAASGVNHVERDGVSHQHRARFVLIGTMNPDEGELRPQLLDRFGLSVNLVSDLEPATRVEIVQRRLAFDTDPVQFCQQWQADVAALRLQIQQAQAQLPQVQLSAPLQLQIAEQCHAAQVEGVRADLTIWRAARAHAAWQQRLHVHEDDIACVAELALRHRRPVHTPPPPARSYSPPPNGAAANTPHTSSGQQGALQPQSSALGQVREVPALAKKR